MLSLTWLPAGRVEMETVTDLAAKALRRGLPLPGPASCRSAAAWDRFSLFFFPPSHILGYTASQKAPATTWALRPQRESTVRSYTRDRGPCSRLRPVTQTCPSHPILDLTSHLSTPHHLLFLLALVPTDRSALALDKSQGALRDRDPMSCQYMSTTHGVHHLLLFCYPLKLLLAVFAFGILVSDLLVRSLHASSLAHATLTATRRLGRCQRSPCLTHYSPKRRLVEREHERRLHPL
ncbi:hypothetical protein B0J12DRAFT_180277 [Macrophomina phaseolina]|uniref:Uncharacterized protein n=1 Tax=Macrophomina phaseolina TaxID=35725 RepID=A0ABQ8G4B4_9PEZI|nr:hypothetical protein B0J12DRAFT_180277 [Macrophomina phaseolina]